MVHCDERHDRRNVGFPGLLTRLHGTDRVGIDSFGASSRREVGPVPVVDRYSGRSLNPLERDAACTVYCQLREPRAGEPLGEKPDAPMADTGLRRRECVRRVSNVHSSSPSQSRLEYAPLGMFGALHSDPHFA